MKEFLEKALRQTVCIEENKELYDRLPLAYKGKTNGGGYSFCYQR